MLKEVKRKGGERGQLQNLKGKGNGNPLLQRGRGGKFPRGKEIDSQRAQSTAEGVRGGKRRYFSRGKKKKGSNSFTL